MTAATPAFDAQDPRATLMLLTKRERECVELRCQGLTTDGVAFRLGIDHNTAKNHVAAAFKKIGVSSIAEMCTLVGRCRERELVSSAACVHCL
jgi:DNA-binding CsgD family transcriptional regulator